MNRSLRPLGALLLLALAPAPDTRAQIQGVPEQEDYFGRALAVGNFDGDGFDDLAVGVPGENVGTIPDAGAVNVVYGASGGLSDTGDQIWTQDSPGVGDAAEAGDLFGDALAVGDFDGDGFDDLAIGSFGESRNGLGFVGQVHVLYGSPAGLTAAGSFYLPQLTAIHSGKRFGEALAAGDFNGDGRDDLAVGVPGQNLGSQTAAGAVAVFFGSAGGVVTSGYQVWHQNVAGVADQAEPYDDFGTALAAGDFDGDSRDDLAISVLFEDLAVFPHPFQENAGAAHVLYGTSSGLATAGSQFWHRGSPGVEGDLDENDFGASLAAGDFDWDGADDLAIGVPFDDVGSTNAAGAVNVIYGSDTGLTADGDQLWHQDSPGVEDEAELADDFGRALAAGDFNTDGRDDLAIGARYENLGGVTDVGAVNVLYGTSGGGLTATFISDEFWWQGTPDIPGDEEFGDRFGSALAAGDFSNLSSADALAIGVPDEAVGSIEEAGAVNVIYGTASGGLGTNHSQIFHQGYDLQLTASGSEEGAEASALAEDEPVALALLPPAPNPSAGRTTLRFALPAPGPVRLAVYDALGREVARLADGAHEAGLHEATLDGAALPPGLYLARLTAGTQALTRRLTLVR